MPGPYSSHDTYVSFGANDIGWLTGFDLECPAGDVRETTNVDSAVVGTGDNARVVREYDATSVDPPRLTLTFWGPPGLAALDAGLKGALVFQSPGAVIAGEAIVIKWNFQGRSRQWTTGSVEFQLTGDLD